MSLCLKRARSSRDLQKPEESEQVCKLGGSPKRPCRGARSPITLGDIASEVLIRESSPKIYRIAHEVMNRQELRFELMEFVNSVPNRAHWYDQIEWNAWADRAGVFEIEWNVWAHPPSHPPSSHVGTVGAMQRCLGVLRWTCRVE